MGKSTGRLTLANYSIGLLIALFTARASAQASAINLLDVHAGALANNARLSAARHALHARGERVAQARAGLLPTLSLHASEESADTRGAGQAPGLQRQGTLYRATLTQPLLRLDRWYALEATHADSQQARFAFDDQQQSLILECAVAYFEALRAQDALAATRAQARAAATLRDHVAARLAQGAANRPDLLDAQAALDLAIASSGLAERTAQDTLEALGRLIGKPVSQLAGMAHGAQPSMRTAGQADAWVARALAQNPMLLADGQGVEVARQALRQRKAAHAPTVDAVLGYRQGDAERFGLAGNRHVGHAQIAERVFSLELTIPLFNGGLDISRTRESSALLAQREDEREDRRRQVMLNVRNLHRALSTDLEQLDARLQSVWSSHASLEANQKGQQLGTRDTADVMQAQGRYFNAVRHYNDARYNLIIDHFKLKQAAGSLTRQDIIEISSRLNNSYNAELDFAPSKLELSTYAPLKQRYLKTPVVTVQASREVGR